MNIEQLLQEYQGMRLTYNRRWMVYDSDAGQWEVYDQQYSKLVSTVVYQGDSAEEALEMLSVRQPVWTRSGKMKARASQDIVIIVDVEPSELRDMADRLGKGGPFDQSISLYGTIRPHEGFEVRFIKPIPRPVEE